MRRDCCAPRAHRVPEALSLVRGHRKSPEDDQLTEDPLPSNSSCRRPPYFVLCSLSLAPSPRGDVTFYTDLTIFQRAARSMDGQQRFNAPRLDSIPSKFRITNTKKTFNKRTDGCCYFYLLLLFLLISRTRARKVSLAFFDSCHETKQSNVGFNCRSKINPRLKMRCT